MPISFTVAGQSPRGAAGLHADPTAATRISGSRIEARRDVAAANPHAPTAPRYAPRRLIRHQRQRESLDPATAQPGLARIDDELVAASAALSDLRQQVDDLADPS
jgi:hypothetical protein